MNMNLLKYRWYFVAFFMLTTVLSVLFLFFNPYNNWGTKPGDSLNLGVDFKSGTKIYFPVTKPVTSMEVMEVLQTIKLPDFKISAPQPSQYIDSKGNVKHRVLIYTRFLKDTEQDVVVNALQAKFGVDDTQGLDITRVSPLIGKELVNNSIIAMIVASLLMLVYIWFRFEFISGVAAVFALVHDCFVVLGIFGLLGLEINGTIIATILTILGYSINDTIVVFDRIRENLKYHPKVTSFVELANDSILQTFRRSLNTGFTSLFAIMVLFVTVPNIREFCFALIVGITSGTYSSIFVASPIWAVYKDWAESRKALRKTATATR
jgi:preprotein translocase subunit SecF